VRLGSAPTAWLAKQPQRSASEAAAINRANEWNEAVRAIGKPLGWRTVTGEILQNGEANGKRLDTSSGTYVRSKEGAITGQK
jgi:hypothetical protein